MRIYLKKKLIIIYILIIFNVSRLSNIFFEHNKYNFQFIKKNFKNFKILKNFILNNKLFKKNIDYYNYIKNI